LNLLFDAVRKLVSIVGNIFNKLLHTIWRQKNYNIKKLKKLIRKFQNMRRSTSTNEEKRLKRTAEIIELCTEILNYATDLVYKALSCMESLKANEDVSKFQKELNNAESFVVHAERQIDQIKRRIILDEKIPHNEKVFSIYEPYVEWLVKGKAGTPQELGLTVCIFKDQFGFLLNHMIMKKKVDKDIAVSFTQETKSLFPNLSSGSFDKGFWKPDNMIGLEKILDKVVLSKKGRLSNADKERQSSDEFKDAKRKHSAVEASISALENHGLDKCPDRGEETFERYVAFAVVGRNTQILGDLIQKKIIKKNKRSASMKEVKLRAAA
jgi:transposase, IS5 family